MICKTTARITMRRDQSTLNPRFSPETNLGHLWTTYVLNATVMTSDVSTLALNSMVPCSLIATTG
jgi:hypothetical protein